MKNPQIRVQDVAKILNKHGLKKKSSKRVDGKLVFSGNYEARKFNYMSVNCHILPSNGTTTQEIIDILLGEGVVCSKLNGYVVIYK